MTSLFERFERSEIELFDLNQIVDIGHVWFIWAEVISVAEKTFRQVK